MAELTPGMASISSNDFHLLTVLELLMIYRMKHGFEEGGLPEVSEKFADESHCPVFFIDSVYFGVAAVLLNPAYD